MIALIIYAVFVVFIIVRFTFCLLGHETRMDNVFEKSIRDLIYASLLIIFIMVFLR